jgi:hypothetical protein
MELMQATKSCNGRGNIFEGLGDSGANVHIANKELFDNLVKLGYKYKQEIKNKRINTAGKESFMKISGWITVGGYIKEMAVVLEAQESLIGIVKLATVGVETQIKEEIAGVQFNLYTNGMYRK